jgi:DNA-binding response OmpR family regulator
VVGEVLTSAGRLQILHVEDDSTLAEMYRLGLERNGFGVTVAGDGLVALQLLAERQFDLVLLDMQLPGMDGVELLATLRREHCSHGLPVAVLSNLDREEPVLARVEELGVLGCLVKSRTVPMALVEHIRGWLPQGAPGRPEPGGADG